MPRVVDTFLPVSDRAEAALPLLRRGHADFRAACDRVASCRDAVAHIAARSGMADAIGPSEERRVRVTLQTSNDEAVLATIERQWTQRIEKYEHWARAPATQRHGPVAFDRRDHTGPGWWHGP
jgi:hypothetical protein